MNMRIQNLTTRISDEKLRQAAVDCLNVADRYKARSEAIRADANLTQVGRTKALKDEATNAYLPSLKAAFLPIAKALGDAAEARKAFSIPAPDQSNIAAAMERQEIRSWLRGLDPVARLKVLMGDIEHGGPAGIDERLVDAALSAPPALSGLEQHYEKVLEATLDRRFGEKIAAVRAAEEIAQAAEAAMLVAKNDIKSISGVDDKTFGAMERHGVDTPWLKKVSQTGTRMPNGDFVGSASGTDRREYVAVFTPGKATDNVREATADELARGKYYSNFDEYRADHPAIAA
ncbi:hypothetical protein EN814_16360 [Mesorhizobium sp. M2D.F.Ca.ET.171.01.1.1]|uniref:hypothetical protein n=1 Tax=unclassified Mesorhizobium TaxID=325217 RepID=UPI0010932FDC|nr:MULTISPECIES: hypothetical protein [unclassified Mesorhizobium]TGS95275.1 hypothetical protein EN821_16375 [Mesorhizobium sp. M2D.F.Ca.ET.178.01.1.1]TGT10814.1 hypothetical protein EN814_16360 [Mesorhizobium sp. M2D.F.Ca.ET.171.01.1.1]